jgi:hypothetical protein
MDDVGSVQGKRIGLVGKNVLSRLGEPIAREGSMRLVRAQAFVLFFLVLSSGARGETMGAFAGDFLFRWNGQDGRTMTLVSPLSYTDPKGVVWDVPAGAVTDGASIPRLLWTIAGGPFEGKYRAAAVVHDYYCETKARPWRDTHLVFYYAMRTAGLDELPAKTYYAAVYYFGPRWGIGTASKGPGEQRSLTEHEQTQILSDLRSWIERERPDVATIGDRLDVSDPTSLR